MSGLALTAAGPSNAAVPATPVDLSYADAVCSLGYAERKVLNFQVEMLNERLRLAASEALDHPAYFERIKNETREAMERLRTNAGMMCMSSYLHKSMPRILRSLSLETIDIK